ncbi:MAG: peroxiredoxin, partial [Promethearchaeota archaeon]
MLNIGELAPFFCLQDQNEKEHCLENYRGKWVILYFYPKDNTPGCTLEAKDFTKELDAFNELDAQILGVSGDTCSSHKRFIDKYNLRITLLADPNKDVIKKYGIWQQKQMRGKKYMGIVRSTLIIDP